MQKPTIIAIILLLISTFTLPLTYSYAQTNTTSQTNENTTGIVPNVEYETQEEIVNYLTNTSDISEFSKLGYGMIGDVNNIEIAYSGNYSYAAMTAMNENQSNRVYIQISVQDGRDFGPPVEITNTTHNNASQLHIAALENNVNVVWKDTANNGTTSIITSTSMDNGHNFKTYKLNVSNKNATDPEVTSGGNQIITTWIQQCTDNKSASGEGNSTNIFGNQCPPNQPNHTDGQGHSKSW
jgi:hypothetical protein